MSLLKLNITPQSRENAFRNKCLKQANTSSFQCILLMYVISYFIYICRRLLYLLYEIRHWLICVGSITEVILYMVLGREMYLYFKFVNFNITIRIIILYILYGIWRWSSVSARSRKLSNAGPVP